MHYVLIIKSHAIPVFTVPEQTVTSEWSYQELPVSALLVHQMEMSTEPLGGQALLNTLD